MCIRDRASGMGLDAVLMNEQMKYAVLVIACFPIMILYPLSLIHI